MEIDKMYVDELSDDLESLLMSAGKEEKDKKPTATDSDLKNIANLAEKKLLLEQQIETAMAALKDLEEANRILTEVHIPQAMEAVGMSEFKLLDGRSVQIKEETFASIKKDSQEEAFEWLDAIGHGGIIKTNVSVPFDRGEAENAEKLSELLIQNGYTFESKQSIHHSTLKAFVKSQMMEGVIFPDTFSICVKRIATIADLKTPKKAKLYK